MLELRKLANETGVAIVLVHHLRKADADDAFDTETSSCSSATPAGRSCRTDADASEIEFVMQFDRDACT